MQSEWLSEIKTTINARINSGNWPASYLLPLSESLGGKELGKYIAQKLMCTAQSEGVCGECYACLSVEKEEHPDLMIIRSEPEQAVGVIKIDQLRAAIRRLSASPSVGASQVMYIENCEQMTQQCANALLKTLEEPKQSLMIIMQTGLVKSLLPTIISRVFKERVEIKDSVCRSYIDHMVADSRQYKFLRYSHLHRVGEIAEIIKDDRVFTLYKTILRTLALKSWQPMALAEAVGEYEVREITDAVMNCLLALESRKNRVSGCAIGLYNALSEVIDHGGEVLTGLEVEGISKSCIEINQMAATGIALNKDHLRSVLMIKIWQFTHGVVAV